MNTKFCIISDGSCDIPGTLARQHQIDIVHFPVSFDGIHYKKKGLFFRTLPFSHVSFHKYCFPALRQPASQSYISAYFFAELFQEKSAAMARSTILFHSRFLS